jgi:hypothetical protein
MRKPRKFLPALVLGITGAISVAAPSFAFPITYTEQAIASGSLNGVTFTDESVLLTMITDTANVTEPSTGIFENVATSPITATVSVNGAAAVTFTDSIAVFSSQTPSSPPAEAGFADLTLERDILDTGNAAFATYDLKSFIGPISGSPANIDFNVSFPTTGGAFILTGVAPASSPTSTFTAAVPAPLIGRGLPVLIAVGGVFFGAKLVERRRNRGAA